MNRANFKKKIWAYYRAHRRSFAWRKTRDPYRILVSEVMLQQTQVGRVEVKYTEFLKVFPTIRTLARAPLSRVLKVWQGLGYNRRALNLQKAAKMIVTEHNGTIPHTTEELERLPGIGPATAAAIRAFAFNKPSNYLDTNVRRVFIHHFFPQKKKVSDRELIPLIEQTLERTCPREWYYALLDYGASLPKTITNPNRRSAHYIRQSTFEGSHRQLRGAILRILTKQGRTSVVTLARTLDMPVSDIRSTLRTLTSEGFLRVMKGSASLF